MKPGKVKLSWWAAGLLIIFACSGSRIPLTGWPGILNNSAAPEQLSLVVLGNVQDAGSPQAGCRKDCCKGLFLHPDETRKVVSLGIVDPAFKRSYLVEATPDLPAQIRLLNTHAPEGTPEIPEAVFLTHAHIGHYTGLMYLGREAMNTNGDNVYAMPRMRSFLENNGPWSLLVKNRNIQLQPMENGREIALRKGFGIMPITVPHRDEFSETVGFIISGPDKKALFIPDIDKWEKWEQDISRLISTVDYAFIDGTFFNAAEISNRNIAEIPHPFITESLDRFSSLPASEKSKIYFIHFNHTNPLLDPNNPASKQLEEKGYHIARMGQVFSL